MDTEALAKGMGLLGAAITTLKQIVDLLPDNSNREFVKTELEKAEQQFKIAQSESAVGLGYEICRQHFPPVIMLSKDDKNWECPECHNTKSPEDYIGTFTQYFNP